MTTEFRQLVEFSPAWDKRDPDPRKNYGIGPVKIRFVLIGPKGAVHWLVRTNWELPHVRAELDRKGYKSDPLTGYDRGYHSPKPTYEGQQVCQYDCEYIGGPCYCDGSVLASEELVDVLVRNGSDGIWKALREDYEYRFGETPTEGMK